MDLNPFPPKDWRLEDGPYEVAEYCATNRVNVLVLLNAWLDPGDGDEEDTEEPSWSTVNYWAARLRPFWTESTSVNAPEQMQGESGSDRTIVVICNRCGEENGGLCHFLHNRTGDADLDLFN